MPPRQTKFADFPTYKNKGGEERFYDNVVRIGSKDKVIYNQVIIDKLQRYDEIIISVHDAYRDRAEVIIREWTTIALEIVGSNSNRPFEVPWQKKEMQTISKERKEPFIEVLNVVTLRKHPDFFKYTNY